MKKKIAIIGSGIAGLTLANLIKKHSDHDFMLYEKEESLSLNKGYGIQLAINSIKILKKINFDKIKKDEIYHPNNVNFLNIKNEKICELNISKFNSIGNQYTTLQRSTLIEFLKEDIYTQHLRFGKRIKKVSELKGKILIKFEDNSNDLVDYVIGADGIFSNTRTFFEKKKNPPIFKKAIAIRSILKLETGIEIDKKSINLLLGANTHIVIYPMNNKNEFNMVCIIRCNEYEPDKIKSLIEKKVLNQNLNLKKLFEGEIKSWPLYSTPKIIPSYNKKVFYIGDAFNGFMPTLAQGAGQSIESAYEIFNLLKQDKLDAPGIYFEKRAKRARIVRKRSNLNFFAFHFSNPLMQEIRNTILKFLIKKNFFINRYLGKVYKN
jgi:salicylate hydroxylase